MLRATDLVSHKIENASKHKEIYKTFLQHCYRQIKQKNESKYSHHIYTIPPITLGTSLYSIGNVMLYLQKKLAVGGFRTHKHGPNKLYIEWSHAHSSHNKNRLKSNG